MMIFITNPKAKTLTLSLVLLGSYCLASEPSPVDTTACVSYSGHREALFGHWIYSDGNCRNTRAEILADRSKVPVTGKCTIKTGQWKDPYTGQTFETAKEVEIDHLIPVAEAYRSGAWAWSQERRVEFYNDTSLLVIASGAANSTKRDKDPSKWLPPDTSYALEYIKRWARGKVKYGLTADEEENAYLGKYIVKDSLPKTSREKHCSQ